MALPGNAPIAMTPLDLSDTLLRAGLQLSTQIGLEQLTEQRLADAAGVGTADVRSTFGDLDAFVHVLQQRLAQESCDALRAALWTAGGHRERLLLAAQSYLDLCLVRRGAHRWVKQLSHRSAPLAATRRKHERQFARLLETACCAGWPAAAQAEARLLVAALAEAARLEAAAGTADRSAREAIASFVRSCTEDADWPPPPRPSLSGSPDPL